MEEKMKKGEDMRDPVTLLPQKHIHHELCPFCGSDNLQYAVYSSKKYVECNDCDAIGPSGGPYDKPNGHIEDHFSAPSIGWNKRSDNAKTFKPEGSITLLSCPFCDSIRLECSIYMSSGVVECNDCDAVGPTSDDEGNGDFEDAILVWNNRVWKKR